jgi:hypothetical protein
MAITVSGFGSFVFRDTTNDEVTAMRPNAFTLSRDVTSEDILFYPNSGVNTLQTLTTITTETSWTLSVESGWFSDQMIPFLFDQRAEAATTRTLLKSQVSTIPATPHEVTITGLTADQDTVHCTLIDNSNGDTYMTRVATATGAGATGEFDVSADTITFDASDEGKSVLITYEIAESVAGYGGAATASPLGTIEFAGKFKASNSATTYGIWLPSITLAAGLEFGSGVDNLTYEFSVGTPANYNSPFYIYPLS